MTILPIHIAAGAVAIVSGGITLFAPKGGTLHRNCGLVFAGAMVVMTTSAILVGFMRGDGRFNSMQAVLTLYLVVTGLVTVRRRQPGLHWFDFAATALAFAVGIYDMVLGMEALQRPKRLMEGVPAAAIFVFGAIALLAALGDLRMLIAGGLAGRKRLARHLWRMSFALWIATASFFLGQAKVIPEPLRSKPLLAVPVLLVLGMMFYWMVRVRSAKRALPATREAA
jgi:uncharacterized membrane protein